MITKSFIRKMILPYRMLLDNVTYTHRNERLCGYVSELIGELRAKKIHAFLPIKKNNEPDITRLFFSMWEKEIKVVVSKTDFLFKQMHHFYLERNTSLVENIKGIPEPRNAIEASLDDLDIVFVPLLVGDKQGNRVGYGGGYYDRLLKKTKALKVGLSLSPPVNEIIQKQEWDIPLDYLITPYKIYNYGKNNTWRH